MALKKQSKSVTFRLRQNLLIRRSENKYRWIIFPVCQYVSTLFLQGECFSIAIYAETLALLVSLSFPKSVWTFFYLLTVCYCGLHQINKRIEKKRIHQINKRKEKERKKASILGFVMPCTGELYSLCMTKQNTIVIIYSVLPLLWNFPSCTPPPFPPPIQDTQCISPLRACGNAPYTRGAETTPLWLATRNPYPEWAWPVGVSSRNSRFSRLRFPCGAQ